MNRHGKCHAGRALCCASTYLPKKRLPRFTDSPRVGRGEFRVSCLKFGRQGALARSIPESANPFGDAA